MTYTDEIFLTGICTHPLWVNLRIKWGKWISEGEVLLREAVHLNRIVPWSQDADRILEPLLSTTEITTAPDVYALSKTKAIHCSCIFHSLVLWHWVRPFVAHTPDITNGGKAGLEIPVLSKENYTDWCAIVYKRHDQMRIARLCLKELKMYCVN